MTSRMRSASFAASVALASGNRIANSLAAEARGRVHAANLGFDALRNLFEGIVPPPDARTVVDALEPVDIDHQAGEGSAAPLQRAPALP